MKAVWGWTRRRSRVEMVLASLAALAGLGLAAVVFEAAMVAHLDDPILQAPTRIYGRPLVLYLGMRPGRATVEEQLERLGYVPSSSRDVGSGEYRLGRRSWIIGQRVFRHHDMLTSGGTATVRLGNDGRITGLEDASGRRQVYVALEPELIGTFLGASYKDHVPVRLSDVPDHLVEAVLSVEDQRFFEHRGLDLVRIAGATLANMRAGRVVQGGSTLTQQLARTLFLSPRRTLIRKAREIAIALALEWRHGKQEILEAYLNEVYLGQDGGIAIHGVGRAAQYYFAKDVSALDLSEAATLAALIRGPNIYSPFRRPQAVRARRDLVLRMMEERGAISDEEALGARDAQLEVRETQRPPRSVRYFLDYVGEQLDAGNRDAFSGGGLAVFTTLDMRLQSAAEGAVREGLKQLEAQYPDLLRLDSPLQAALVAIDPRSGEILTMVGGRDYGSSQFNRAVKARRQPGSAFKPIVSIAALSRRGWDPDDDERPFTLASVLHDERLVVQTPQGPWEPVNYDRRFRGPIALRDALERSLNVPFARLGMAVGPQRIVETARALGIGGPLIAVPSIALGSNEVTPLELTRAYGVLAAGGYRAESRAVLGALDREGNVIARNDLTGEQVYDPAEAYLVTSALRGAVERGTGRGLRTMGYRGDVAAKSGTTNDFRDGWFIGYTPSLAVGVWVGFDDGQSIDLPGARVALPIFTRFLVAALGEYGDSGPYGGAEFTHPPGLEMVEIDPRTGLRAGPGCRGTYELFLRGTAPRQSCSPWFRVIRYLGAGEFRFDDEVARLRRQLLRLLERDGRRRGGGNRFE
ncbi:MAG: PBP1A family penicillin-binding protein [Gemmatimonadota bacterium]|nr:MAG: PBP1A family penicillin-binding protein [Gemmatimonadota bacterium]